MNKMKKLSSYEVRQFRKLVDGKDKERMRKLGVFINGLGSLANGIFKTAVWVIVLIILGWFLLAIATIRLTT